MALLLSQLDGAPVFDPATLNWTLWSQRIMDSTRITIPRTDFEGWGDAAVNYPEEFFPAIAQLTNSFRNVRISSLYAQNDENLLGGYFEAGQFRWTIPTERMGTGAVYGYDTNTDTSWIAPILAFDPTQQAWFLDSQRVRGMGYLRDSQINTSWILGVFDPVLYAAMAQIHGTRTPSVSTLAVQLQWSLYDLGWLHDVIPLTDPSPSADTVYLRPIAPIMSARRRNKRRR